jgi:hypothetical protein
VGRSALVPLQLDIANYLLAVVMDRRGDFRRTGHHDEVIARPAPGVASRPGDSDVDLVGLGSVLAGLFLLTLIKRLAQLPGLELRRGGQLLVRFARPSSPSRP